MHTDELIDRLVAGHRRVDPRWIERASLIAAVAGLAAAIALVGSTIGFRHNVFEAFADGRILAKYGFVAFACLTAGLVYARMARPGRQIGRLSLAYLLPLGFIILAAVISAAVKTPAEIVAIITDPNWRFCLVLVPTFAIVPFALFTLVLRRAAPTDLRGAGFATGVFATSLTALAYASHCPADWPLFVAIWYPLAFLIGGLLGAIAAPRLIRW